MITSAKSAAFILYSRYVKQNTTYSQLTRGDAHNIFTRRRTARNSLQAMLARIFRRTTNHMLTFLYVYERATDLM